MKKRELEEECKKKNIDLIFSSIQLPL